MQRKRTWWIKQWEHDSILSRAHAPGPFDYVLVLDRLKASYNVAKILRTANVLGAREVHLCGMEKFDPSPGKGALRHTRTRVFADTPASLRALRDEGYVLHALAVDGAATLGRCALPVKSAFVLGHEEWGFSFDAAAEGITTLRIAQFGVVQSLNVSIAASLAAFEWCRQHAPA